MHEKIENLRRYQRAAALGGGVKAIEIQHGKGKMTARERISYLLDIRTFNETGMHARGEIVTPFLDEPPAIKIAEGDGVVTGWGNINNRQVFVFAQDFTSGGGSVGEIHARKIQETQDLARKTGCPFIGISDGGGARIHEGVVSLTGYGGIFRRNVEASGVIPQISIIAGPSAGGAAYSPALTDFVFMVDKIAYMYITGPDIVRTETGELTTHADLGGAFTHFTKSGVAHFIADNEAACMDDVKRLLSFLPSNSNEKPSRVATSDPSSRKTDKIQNILDKGEKVPYDMRNVIGEIVDDQDFMEYSAGFGRTILTGFARIDGHSVGIVANQPNVLGGVLDIDACEKAARFVRTCDAFNIPLISLVDVPGFLPGQHEEHSGLIRHGAKLLYAFSEASVPRIQLIVGKAYGGAYVLMNSKSLGADLSFAYPSARPMVLDASGAVDVLYRRELQESDDPENRRKELIEEYEKEHANPYIGVERGIIDDVIDPADTRRTLASSLELLRNKKEEQPTRKHGNVPL